MNLHHLELFQTVAHAESFSKAAERLGVSQPAVSVQIRRLEERLGVPLVQVLGRRLVLTPAGQQLADYADRVVSLAREAERRMQELRSAHQGQLRVGATPTPGTYLVPRLVAAYRREHPQVALTVEVDATPALVRSVAQLRLDAAIVEDATGGESVSFRPLRRDPFVAVLPLGHPLTDRTTVSLPELAGYTLVLGQPGTSLRSCLEQALQDTGRSTSEPLVMGSTEGVKQAVREGLGVAALPRLAVTWEAACGALVTRPLAEPAPHFPLFLASPQGLKLSPAAEAFRAMVEALLAEDRA